MPYMTNPDPCKVCGLHLWTNLAVIPKVENLRKGNKNSVHD